MPDQVLTRVYNYIEEHHMLGDNRHVIMGISGGADSMCLLFVLESLKEKLGLRLTAVHINHGLRGEAADADQRYVENYCRTRHIECITFKTDIRTMAEKQKLSEEEAGRIFRYDCFQKVLEEKHAGCIAVAHHQDDQAETVLFNLVRGSGLAGLSGILPVRDRIIRPLLCLNRREIESFLMDQGISFCVDQTNGDTSYTRNKIRHHVIPYLTEEINSEAAGHIARSAEYIRDVMEYLRTQARKILEDIEDIHGGLQIEDLKVQPEVIQKEIFRLWIREKTGRLKDITSDHIQSILELKDKPEGKYICLPYGYCVRRTGASLVIEKQPARQGQDMTNVCHDISVNQIPGIYMLDDQFCVEFHLKKYLKNMIIPENSCTKWFDYDKIKGTLMLRKRRTGDMMAIASGRSKTIRRMMIDDKIPAKDRDRIWLLAENNHILWVTGGRISEQYKVTKDTKTILVVCLKEKKHGRQN